MSNVEEGDKRKERDLSKAHVELELTRAKCVALELSILEKDAKVMELQSTLQESLSDCGEAKALSNINFNLTFILNIINP
jgi:hypothetical protein